MGSCVNIGAGKNEIMLSTIFWIVSKFVQGDATTDNDSVYRNFQMKFGEQVMTEGINILAKNLARYNNGDEEDKEKYQLSLAIITFLKSSSKCPLVTKYFKNKEQIFK